VNTIVANLVHHSENSTLCVTMCCLSASTPFGRCSLSVPASPSAMALDPRFLDWRLRRGKNTKNPLNITAFSGYRRSGGEKKEKNQLTRVKQQTVRTSSSGRRRAVNGLDSDAGEKRKRHSSLLLNVTA